MGFDKTAMQAVRFFHTATELYKGLTTYDALASEGILPSSTQTYTYDQIAKAIKKSLVSDLRTPRPAQPPTT
jgi:hypothetical protein